MPGTQARVATVAIAGLGLIGGSLAAALRESGFAARIVGWGRRDTSLRRGVELGVIDAYTLSLEEALAADIFVICTPTLVAADLLQDVLRLTLDSDRPPVITDAASVKGNLQRAALDACDGSFPAHLVLGHPIAGSERSGVDAAQADLYRDHRVILTPQAETDAAALALVRDMWLATGAEVVEMDVARHDAVLAATSHLPHVLAYALVDALARSDASEEIFRFAAGGFRDFTRIASSDPVMWRDIAIANRPALLEAIDQFSAHLGELRAAVETGDADGLHSTFTRAKAARDRFAASLAERGKGSSDAAAVGQPETAKRIQSQE
ncbi:prephenate dehydrogenase/arogenate dehydrogenase family protein [Mangrovimicrobium sediminis]|uniref:prephenate dehydrogenase n=1 Tax=Mangrovimicrobium sediminis TaxID=2562682 RepID=A0A4Z0M1J2_9GAMM|nr:prephenate dehydrogenase/arogenate dehydrogenase family protein [Haliea sp. SAOS-164]TGD73472.1 prephenate dehydrogenase/arogenate dehydrogenase family protein [Haliea sp. SAOS-164]